MFAGPTVLGASTGLGELARSDVTDGVLPGAPGQHRHRFGHEIEGSSKGELQAVGECGDAAEMKRRELLRSAFVLWAVGR